MSKNSSVGYLYNDGGISNQKFALLGLCAFSAVQAPSERRSIYLPMIWSRDQAEEKSSLHNFSTVFQEGVFRDFCGRWGLTVTDKPDVPYADRIGRGGWNFFTFATAHVEKLRHNTLDAESDIAVDFFRSLVPHIQSARFLRDLCDEVFSKKKINTVAQFRIERDWQEYCAISLRPILKDTEDYCLEPERIVEKIKRSINNLGDTIFVVCDERYMLMSKQEIAQRTYDKTGVKILWKSDLMPTDDFNALSPLEASLIDFEVSILAERFVGNSRSTFTNLTCFERFVRSSRPRESTFIYNQAGPTLGLRNDCGTKVLPSEVCAD